MEYPRGMIGRITYSPDFPFQTMQDFALGYQGILGKMADNPDGTLGDIL